MKPIYSIRLKRVALVGIDTLLITLSLVMAYLLRFATTDLGPYGEQVLAMLPVLIAARIATFAVMGLYRGMWRFVGMHDLALILNAVTLSSIIFIAILFLITRLTTYPRSVFAIEWFISIVLIGGSRFAYRLYREGMPAHERGALKKGASRVLIVGAGHAGAMLLREITVNKHLSYLPVGLVDDDRSKRDQAIHGVRVLGNTRDIPRLVSAYGVNEVFLALPQATRRAKMRIAQVCRRANVKCKTLPAVGEILNGNVAVSSLRQFDIEDLLGREPVRLDLSSIQEYLRDKTVLITGAGGSIGSELCRQVLRFAPKQLLLLDQHEYNLYQIQMNLQELFPEADVQMLIGDVVNEQRVESILGQFQPEVVFHAAAYKHVPLMEMNAEEALRNNVLGTWNMASLSCAAGVKKFVLVSTDKAVRPTNIMGASKRIAEMICQLFNNKEKTRFVTVRFGNVLNSVGSVIPLFRQQIARGGPVTVTHPEIYRFFMTIPEAVQLIMQAGALGKGGETFLLDMGQPVKIVDLARDMIRLSGLQPGKDVMIAFIGLRPGEKLYEELLTADEEVRTTQHEKIMIAGREQIDYFALLGKIELLLYHIREGIPGDYHGMVRNIVEDYQPELGGPGTSANALRELK